MKFSIIMPTYNCEKYVKIAIESVLAQTYDDFELIIVDDGSQDNTYKICQQLFKENEKIRVFQKEHGGVSAARNFGIKKSKGENILFIDCDDFWDENLLELCCPLVEENKGMVLFGIRSLFFYQDDTLAGSETETGDSGETQIVSTDENISAIFSVYNMASPCNKIYKKDILEKNNILFSEKCVYLEDMKFNFDYLRYCDKIHILKKALYNYRLFRNQNQIFKRQFKGLFVNADELFSSVSSFVQEKNTAIEKEEVLSGMLIAAYFREFISHSYGKSKKEQKGILKELNNNSNFNRLLKFSGGQFYKLLKIAKALHIGWAQIRLINWRF